MTFLYLSYLYMRIQIGAPRDRFGLCFSVRARFSLTEERGESLIFHLQTFQSVHIWAGRSLMIPLGYHAAYVDTYIKRIES
jgi:hypothetical protein